MTMAEENDDRRYRPSLQGLLQFSVNVAQNSGSNPEAEDSTSAGSMEERKQWLMEALSGMTVDLVKKMIEHLEILKKNETSVEEKEFALEELTELCENIDLAIDFHKIGGYDVLKSLLCDENSEIRWRTAELVASLVQNNPYCQKMALDYNLVETLLNAIDTDTTDSVRIKALYAVSCLCRDYGPALDVFVKNDGFSVVLRGIQSDVEKLRTKGVFFITGMLTSRPSLKDTLCDIGMVEQLVGLLQTVHSLFHEYLLRALLELSKDHPRSISECQRSEFHLQQILKDRIAYLNGKEEFQEEKESAEELLGICFSEENKGTHLER